MSCLDFDVVIVGAGVAGSLLAYDLAGKGRSVLVLEAGPRLGSRQHHTDRFYQVDAKVPGSPWPHEPEANSPGVLDLLGSWQDGGRNHMHQTGPMPFGSTYERVEGGTGNHWQGVAPRLIPNDFRMSSEYGGPEGAPDWPISYDDLETWYQKAEEMLGVSGDHKEWKSYLQAKRSKSFPMPAIPNSHMDQVVSKILKKNGSSLGGKKVKMMTLPQARNSVGYDGRPPCMGNSNCIPICPITAKYNPAVHLRRAEQFAQNPAQIIFQAVARSIQVDSTSGRVKAVEYLDWDGKPHRASGKFFVIAANAIESARLLLQSHWRSGNGRDWSVGNRSGQVGRNLMDHVIHLAWGLLPKDRPGYSFRGPQSTGTIGEFRDGKERSEYAAWNFIFSNTGWGWARGAPVSTVQAAYRRVRDEHPRAQSGTALREAVKEHLSRQISFTAEFEQLPSPYNRVTLSHHRDKLGIPKPKIAYTATPYTRRGFEKAAEIASELMKQFGKKAEHTSPQFGSPSNFEFNEKTYTMRGAGHIMGTTRMGNDPETSVVDRDLRAHDHENMFVVGSSVFPTVGTANPTLTIAALALRAADYLDREL